MVDTLEPRVVLSSVPLIGPTITEPATLSVNQDTTASFTGANAISIADPLPLTEQFSATVVHGTLTVNPIIGVTATGNGTGTLMLSGSLTNVNAALATLSYHPTAGYSGSDTLSLFLQNSTTLLNDSGAVAITVNPTNIPAAPVFTAPMSVSVTPGTAFAFSGANSISLTDTAGGAEQFSMTVQHGTLTLGTTTGLTISGNGTGTVIISGSASNLNAGLATLSYQPTTGFTGNDRLGMYVRNSTSNLSASAGVTLVVGSNAAPPAFTAPSSASVAKDTTLPFTGANAISVADSSAGIEQFSVVVQHGIISIGSTTGMTISGNNSGTVIMTGTLANLNAALATMTYHPSSGYTGSDTLTMTDQNASTNKATLATINLLVIANNGTPPAITAPVATISVLALVSSNANFTGSNAISVSDTTGGIEQFSMTAQHGTLTVGATNGISISGNGTGTIVISATLDNLNAALSSLSYQPVSTYVGPDTLAMYVLNPISSLSASAAVQIVDLL